MTRVNFRYEVTITPGLWFGTLLTNSSKSFSMKIYLPSIFGRLNHHWYVTNHNRTLTIATKPPEQNLRPSAPSARITKALNSTTIHIKTQALYYVYSKNNSWSFHGSPIYSTYSHRWRRSCRLGVRGIISKGGKEVRDCRRSSSRNQWIQSCGHTCTYPWGLLCFFSLASINSIILTSHISNLNL